MENMVKKLFLSGFYAINQIGLGLLLHPYQTMQPLVQENFFVWMTLFPSGVLAIVTMLWRFLLVPVLRLVFSCQTSSAMILMCKTLPFFSNWLTFFCIYWQILLLYLFFRFWGAFKSQKA